MRPDLELQFLQYCENGDLKTLCDILMYDNKGNLRTSESLSDRDSYLSCYPESMKGMWQDLANEVCCFGGNSVLNYFRNGRGPAYETIVFDVCKKLKVKDISKHDTAEEMEQKLLLTISEKAVSEMTEEQIRSIMEDCDIRNYSYTKAGLIAALYAMRLLNRRVYIILIDSVMTMLSRILIGRGVAIIGMGVITRGFGFLLGPVGWAILFGWTAWDIMGPAYRVTIPAVLQIAYMRMKYRSVAEHTSPSA